MSSCLAKSLVVLQNRAQYRQEVRVVLVTFSPTQDPQPASTASGRPVGMLVATAVEEVPLIGTSFSRGPYVGDGGGGRLVDPPNRSSLWRQRVRGAPINTRDNQLNCGASWMPIAPSDRDEQSCGVCGDSSVGPQDHVLGGRYVTFPLRVSRDYTATGSLAVSFFLNHTVVPGLDKVTFHLCPLTRRFTDVTWDCFADSPAVTLYGWGDAYYPSRPGMHRVYLQLPATFTCNHCVLQWRWQSSHMGDTYQCTRQPWLRSCYLPVEYINCADIRIRPAAYFHPLRQLEYLLLAGANS
nr:hypothetical protein BaRGS_007725 [Batillaria attramentaria]